jgi:hypothetical protein
VAIACFVANAVTAWAVGDRSGGSIASALPHGNCVPDGLAPRGWLTNRGEVALYQTALFDRMEVR